jgi:hypothetical protein
MELTSPREIQPFEMIIDRYERAFHDRDLAAFRALHVHDGRLVFFDNHAGCDSSSYLDHEARVRAFFESGAIVGLLRESLRVFVAGEMACMTAVHRYSTRPTPGVRTTYVLEREEGEWRIRHMHHSFDPNDAGSG